MRGEYLVFPPDGGVTPHQTWPDDLPRGARILTPEGAWYLKIFNSHIPVNNCDIPPDVRALCLIMGITTY